MEAIQTLVVPSGLVTVGRVSGLYGVRGWLKIYSYTRPRDNILAYPIWSLSDSDTWVAFTVITHRCIGASVVASLDGIVDRDDAAKWIGSEIAIERAVLPDNTPGEYYWADLIGLDVFNQEGILLGAVTGLLETGANDVLVVNGTRERLIPYVMAHYVAQVDLERGCILVHWHPDD